MVRAGETAAAMRHLEAHPEAPGLQAGVTRRQFVVGGALALGGLAAAGVVAQRALPLRSYWYRLTGQCGPEGPIPEDLAAPTYGTFRSEVLGADVEYGSWVPRSGEPAGRHDPGLLLPARSRPESTLGA